MNGRGWSGGMAGLAVAILVCGTAVRQASAESAEGSKRIAVVNVSRVFNAYKKVKDIQGKMNALFDDRNKALLKEEEELQRQANLLNDGVDPKTSKPKLEKIHALEIARFDLEKKKFDLAMDIEKKQMDEMKQVLREIRSAINEIGKREKVDLVLRAPEFDAEGNPATGVAPEGNADDQAARSSSELVKRFRENPVLYFSLEVDITQPVITKLNDEYKPAGGGK